MVNNLPKTTIYIWRGLYGKEGKKDSYKQVVILFSITSSRAWFHFICSSFP